MIELADDCEETVMPYTQSIERISEFIQDQLVVVGKEFIEVFDPK
jgi:hypothetical protein